LRAPAAAGLLTISHEIDAIKVNDRNLSEIPTIRPAGAARIAPALLRVAVQEVHG
jgi:hypothetical protein